MPLPVIDLYNTIFPKTKKPAKPIILDSAGIVTQLIGRRRRSMFIPLFGHTHSEDHRIRDVRPIHLLHKSYSFRISGLLKMR